jgi:CHAD domain-containing protein
MSFADLTPSNGLTLDAIEQTLTSRLDVREHEVRRTDRTFYDTFDGLLHSHHLSAVHEQGRLAIIDQDSGEERASAAIAKPTAPLLASDLDPGPLRATLEPIIEVRALLPLAHVRGRVRQLDLLDAERKTVARLAVEASAVVSGSGEQTALHPRIRLMRVRGYDDELERLRRRLVQEFGLQPAAEQLVDEAVIAAGGEPGGTPAKVDVHLSPEQRADAAAVAILERLLEVMRDNLEGTIADTDTEFLHDFRVAVRRSRSVQRELKAVFPPAELAEARIEFRWLQQATGDARDMDVYVLEFDDYRAMVPEWMRGDLEPLLGVLRERRLTARSEMVAALQSERAAALFAEWEGLLDGLERLPEDDRSAAAHPIRQVAAQRITKVYSRMLKMGRAIDRSSPPEDYHQLRKKGKELRYLLELFGLPLFSEEVVRPMIRALKALQDVLGRHQDREIQVGTLRSLADEVATLPGGPAALMAMGVLVERLDADQHRARDEFADRFAAFASAEQRAVVKETFAAG